MRDKIKSKEYLRENYEFYFNNYNEKYEEIKKEFEELKDKYDYDTIEDALGGYYYGIFLSGFKTFYAGYSLGMDIEELKPIGEGLLYGLYKNCKWDRFSFEDTRAALIFIIILNIKTEYVEKFIKLIRKDNFKDRYIDHLINYIDEKEEIKAKEILFKKREKTVMEVVDLAKEGKKEEATWIIVNKVDTKILKKDKKVYLIEIYKVKN